LGKNYLISGELDDKNISGRRKWVEFYDLKGEEIEVKGFSAYKNRGVIWDNTKLYWFEW